MCRPRHGPEVRQGRVPLHVRHRLAQGRQHQGDCCCSARDRRRRVAMARIRSIKPEFFTSERIATLPLSARLTFIGLWLYVDDNGVGLDNERLILAAIWPLEEDVIGTLQRTREDLVRLSRDSLIVRYRDDVKRYIAVRSWEEHQRVQHPGKPRYPRQ